MNLTLQQLFGVSATQDSQSLTIHKADLQGLTASSSNRATTLLVALLLQAHQQFEGTLTDEQGRNITSELGDVITFDSSSWYEKMRLFYWRHQFIVRGQQYALDTFVFEIFISPHLQAGTPLYPDDLNY